MARILTTYLRKDPSLRVTYPALKHIRQPIDAELHFRAWCRGGTNLLYLCLCAERTLRIYNRLYDIQCFTNHHDELEEAIDSRAMCMATGKPAPSVLLGPLKLSWPEGLNSTGSSDSVPSLEEDFPVIQGVDEALLEDDAPHEIIITDDNVAILDDSSSDLDAEGQGSSTVDLMEGAPAVEVLEGELVLEHVEGNPTLEHVEGSERGYDSDTKAASSSRTAYSPTETGGACAISDLEPQAATQEPASLEDGQVSPTGQEPSPGAKT